MTNATNYEGKVQITLSRDEALVLYEWLSRNWERSNWNIDGCFEHMAEKQILIWIENDLARILDEPFSDEYRSILKSSYLSISAESDL